MVAWKSPVRYPPPTILCGIKSFVTQIIFLQPGKKKHQKLNKGILELLFAFIYLFYKGHGFRVLKLKTKTVLIEMWKCVNWTVWSVAFVEWGTSLGSILCDCCSIHPAVRVYPVQGEKNCQSIDLRVQLNIPLQEARSFLVCAVGPAYGQTVWFPLLLGLPDHASASASAGAGGAAGADLHRHPSCLPKASAAQSENERQHAIHEIVSQIIFSPLRSTEVQFICSSLGTSNVSSKMNQ